MKAIWIGKIIAESNETINIENNQYFPMETINKEFFIESKTQSVCPWKGEASYFTIKVDGEKNVDAAWYYSQPREMAKAIKNYVAFWKGVKIEK